MYSCNWTMMNLKFKKLLLLSMMMDDANQSMFKITPKKVINVQLFTKVIMKQFITNKYE